MKSIQKVDSRMFDSKIKNALDPQRPINLVELKSTKWKAITEDKSESETRQYFIDCNSNGRAIECTCKADMYGVYCRHRAALNIKKGFLRVDPQVENYRTNGISEHV